MIRITIRDSQQTISFASDEDTLRCLVAGCSVNPVSLSELLVASDVYQRGLAAALMADLVEFDKLMRREGPAYFHTAISQARAEGRSLVLTFQVFDELTGQEASQPRACDLVVIDLTARTIRGPVGLDISASGEVGIRAGEAAAGPRVTYVLPQDWTVQSY